MIKEIEDRRSIRKYKTDRVNKTMIEDMIYSATLAPSAKNRQPWKFIVYQEGWGYEMTPAELTRKDEFYSIYWKEYNAVKNGMNSELKELPDYLEKRPVFEAKA